MEYKALVKGRNRMCDYHDDEGYVCNHAGETCPLLQFDNCRCPHDSEIEEYEEIISEWVESHPSDDFIDGYIKAVDDISDLINKGVDIADIVFRLSDLKECMNEQRS